MATKIIPVGTVFGRLTVTGVGEPTREACGLRQSTSVVSCECGNAKEVRNNSLRRGRSQSCGCFCPIPEKTHGLHGTPEYDAWKGMIQRTKNPQHKSYENYGGRGISVCERWNSLENFMADMGPRPSRTHSIDRIDNERGYEPSNCRWATRADQANNKRTNVRLTFYGKTMTVAGWSRISQISQSTIAERINRGWSEKTAVWTPVKRRVSCSKSRT